MGMGLHASLKAEGLSVNFGFVTTSDDVNPQMYTFPQCLTLVKILKCRDDR